MEKTLKNGELTNLDCKFVLIGTKDIEAWTDGKPYIIALNTEDDFFANGLEYDDFKDMSVSETMTDLDGYEGTIIIRIA